MATRSRSHHPFLPALALALALPAAARGQAHEVHAYGIANFGGSGQCGGAESHSVHTATAAAFNAPFTFLKTALLWDEVYTRNNTSARGSYFTDASKGGSCSCTADDMAANAGADEADIVYVHTHGGRSIADVYSSLKMGNSSYDCDVRTDDNMFLGNGDLEIAVVKACQSGDYDVWKAGGYRQNLTNNASTFTMWNAFHGDSSCGSHVTSYVSGYAWSSLNDGAGENWIDAAYDDDSGMNTDDCPVSIVMGSSASARATMYEYGGWRDRKNTGSKTGSTIFYVGGCDPDHGTVLPN